MKRFSMLVCIALLLSACQTTSGPNQTGGTFLGALAGGLLGSTVGGGNGRLIAVGAGTLRGALAGGAVGANKDQQRTAQQGYYGGGHPYPPTISHEDAARRAGEHQRRIEEHERRVYRAYQCGYSGLC